jgi:hypothetical protein
MPERDYDAYDLALALNRMDHSGEIVGVWTEPHNYWADGYVTIGPDYGLPARELAIDTAASDDLAARLGHPGRNESESRWMVAGGFAVEYLPGSGWAPVALDALGQ